MIRSLLVASALLLSASVANATQFVEGTNNKGEEVVLIKTTNWLRLAVAEWETDNPGKFLAQCQKENLTASSCKIYTKK